MPTNSLTAAPDTPIAGIAPDVKLFPFSRAFRSPQRRSEAPHFAHKVACFVKGGTSPIHRGIAGAEYAQAFDEHITDMRSTMIRYLFYLGG